MEKKYRSCSCPKCYSSNIKKIGNKEDITEVQQEEYHGMPCNKKFITKKVHCMCKHCKTDYYVNLATEIYAEIMQSCNETLQKKYQLLVAHESSSFLSRSYEIYSVLDNFKTKNDDMKKSYFMIIEGVDEQIFISEEEVKEMKNSPEKALSFSYGIWMSRHQKNN